jgi:precorrin-6A synthase
MRKLFVIGIGAGHPDHLTIQAIKAMNAVEVFFFPDKGEIKQDLLQRRRSICESYVTDRNYKIVEIADPVRDSKVASYTARVEQWHEQRAILYEESISTELKDGASGAFLVWGDPMLYDSTLRILSRIAARKRVTIEYEVIPGITSLQALAAAHKTPLNEIGESIRITTGRLLDQQQLNQGETVAVMLDGNCAFRGIQDDDTEICWGAYVGTEREILVSGRLGDVAGEIEQVRSRARSEHGWIMDCYLLRRAKASVAKDTHEPGRPDKRSPKPVL